MPTVLVEAMTVDSLGNAFVDGSGNAIIVFIAVATTPPTQPLIVGREWQWSDHLAEPNRLKTRW